MDTMIKPRQKKNYFILLALMLMVFCVTKVIRGADTLSDSQGGIWNYISLVYYIVFIIACMSYKRIRVSLLNSSLFFYTIFAFFTGCFYINALSRSQIYNLLMVPYFPLVFACFYMIAREEKKSKTIINITFIICILVNMFTIINYQFFGQQRALASDIYFSLCLYPFILLNVTSKKIQNVCTISLFLATFLSGKRAGLIAIIGAILIYNWINSYIHLKKSWNKTITIIGVGLLIWLSFRIDVQNDLGIFNRLFRLIDDGGSGRVDIYSIIWGNFKKSSVLEKLFGHGIYKTLDISGFMAHNDLLEILYDYGIVSAVFIVLFYISLVFIAVRMTKRRSKYAPAFCASLIIGFTLSFASFFIVYYTYVTCMAAFWGYCIALDYHASPNNGFLEDKYGS